MHFVVTNDNNGLFLDQPAIDSAGNLTFAPQPNAFGSAQVTVVLKDDGGTANGGNDSSSPQTFNITISKPHPWHNARPLTAPKIGALDVDLDASISPIDAVLIINYLNVLVDDEVPPNAVVGKTGNLSPGMAEFLDTGGGGTLGDQPDNFVSPIDAVLVINWLNANPVQTQAENSDTIAESDPSREFDDEPSTWADLVAFLALDVASQLKRRRF